jgi:hypothetical protein
MSTRVHMPTPPTDAGKIISPGCASRFRLAIEQ